MPYIFRESIPDGVNLFGYTLRSKDSIIDFEINLSYIPSIHRDYEALGCKIDVNARKGGTTVLEKIESVIITHHKYKKLAEQGLETTAQSHN